jgi:hypothetical protein
MWPEDYDVLRKAGRLWLRRGKYPLLTVLVYVDGKRTTRSGPRMLLEPVEGKFHVVARDGDATNLCRENLVAMVRKTQSIARGTNRSVKCFKFAREVRAGYGCGSWVFVYRDNRKQRALSRTLFCELVKVARRFEEKRRAYYRGVLLGK